MKQKKSKLLIVDDEIEICNYVTAFFDQRGFKVYQAFNGDEALKVAEKDNPDLVLLDLKMKSENDGFEVIPKLREISPGSKIIMVTGADDQLSILRGRELGVDDYITKPLVLSYLEEVVLEKIKKMEE